MQPYLTFKLPPIYTTNSIIAADKLYNLFRSRIIILNHNLEFQGVTPSVLVAHLFLCEGLRSCAGGRPFVSSWFRLKVDKTTCMPFEQMILLYETQP